MKKFALLSVMSGLAFGSFAQAQNTLGIASQKRISHEMYVKQEQNNKLSKYEAMAFAKVTATPFQTFDFSGGTPSTLPTGWTAVLMVAFLKEQLGNGAM